MTKILSGLFLAAFAALASPALGGERMVILSVPGMFCASCPYIVEEAISSVSGVAAVETDLEKRSATVTFDDNTTSVEAILQATANVGYESRLVWEGGRS